MSLAQQVVTLVGAIGKKFVDVPKGEIKKYQGEILEYFENHHSDILAEIDTQKALDDDLKASILSVFDEFGKAYNG